MIRSIVANLRSSLKVGDLSLRNGTVQEDAKAAVVLGVESVPDGLASGLLAGLNPVAGLYAYLYGVTAAAFFTSTAFMAVQGTGAMAIIVADVGLDSFEDPTGALVTLSLLTGVVMMTAGYLRAGVVLRFVPNAVMAGFVSAVGINIVLGQLGDFTGYESTAANRLTRALDVLLHFWRVDLPTVFVGAVTIVLIVGLRRTRLGAMGLVVAVVAGSVFAADRLRPGHTAGGQCGRSPESAAGAGPSPPRRRPCADDPCLLTRIRRVGPRGRGVRRFRESRW